MFRCLHFSCHVHFQSQDPTLHFAIMSPCPLWPTAVYQTPLDTMTMTISGGLVRHFVEYPSFGIWCFSHGWIWIWGRKSPGIKCQSHYTYSSLFDFVSVWARRRLGCNFKYFCFIFEFNSSSTLEPYFLAPPVWIIDAFLARLEEGCEKEPFGFSPAGPCFHLSFDWFLLIRTNYLGLWSKPLLSVCTQTDTGALLTEEGLFSLCNSIIPVFNLLRTGSLEQYAF